MDERCLNNLSETGIIPVIRIEDVEKAVPLAKALREGGFNCTVITFRTAQTEETIRRITKELPDMLLGAGTVLSVDQADRAAVVDAKFMVSPCFNPEVVGHCIERGIPVIPGCLISSDIEHALGCGF